MKVFVLLFTMLLLPAAAWPQTEGSLLAKLSLAVDDKLYEQAENLFHQIVSADIESAEMFYWVHLGRSHVMAPKVAHKLAAYFEKNYDYDKANVFYKECAQFAPADVNRLLAVARTDVLRGKENEAIHTYEHILSMQPDNLDANIYAANYYYLQGEVEKQKIESDYKRIKSPTRMQYAHYRNELDRVFGDKYVKARVYFQSVMKQFSSVGARKALAEIAKVEKEMAR